MTSLQHATVGEAQVKIIANLQYQIENAGLKELRVLLPANADGVAFRGDQVGDFLADGAPTNGLQAWQIKLRRRCIGSYLLQAAYQTPVAEAAKQTVLRGVLAADVNLQRGFATVRSSGACRCAWTICRRPCSRRNGKASRARCKKTCPRRPRIFPIASSSRIFSCR